MISSKRRLEFSNNVQQIFEIISKMVACGITKILNRRKISILEEWHASGVERLEDLLDENNSF